MYREIVIFSGKNKKTACSRFQSCALKNLFLDTVGTRLNVSYFHCPDVQTNPLVRILTA